MSHDVPNMGIVDGSVFVTAGGVNPTSTICALALRAADHLLLHRGPDLGRGRGRREPPSAPARRSPVPEPAPRLDVTERAALGRLAALLIPSDGGTPSVHAVDVSGELVERVLRAAPDLVTPLRRVLAAWPEDQPTTAADIAGLAVSDREAHGALVLVVAGAYYAAPDVRARLLHGEYQPVDARGFPVYVEEGLLDHIVGA